ncbi:hypothetical protein [Cellulomonas sp. Y8]|uniref:hypothetical protein n=1 Tax=Cellulomonas sp. Y8 TaxID=2591145 RepID=UPI003D7549E4
MAPASDAVVIIAYDIDATQRRLIHAAVREESDQWWHELPDVWVAISELNVTDWKSLLRGFVPQPPSGLMVFALPEDKRRFWHRGPLDFTWFRENFDSQANRRIEQ